MLLVLNGFAPILEGIHPGGTPPSTAKSSHRRSCHTRLTFNTCTCGKGHACSGCLALLDASPSLWLHEHAGAERNKKTCPKHEKSWQSSTSSHTPHQHPRFFFRRNQNQKIPRLPQELWGVDSESRGLTADVPKRMMGATRRFTSGAQSSSSATTSWQWFPFWGVGGGAGVASLRQVMWTPYEFQLQFIEEGTPPY